MILKLHLGSHRNVVNTANPTNVDLKCILIIDGNGNEYPESEDEIFHESSRMD